MGTIKIEVNVNVSLSNDVKSFITSLFTPKVCGTPVNLTTVDNFDRPQESFSQIDKELIAAAQAPAAQAPAAPSSTSIEDVRKVLQTKVNEHRQEIKDKLNELGAPSVTKLDPSKYKEMYDFLTQL